MSLELRHLRQVLALAEYGSFARAAESLSISQPALSRSIQSIEGTLGARLFDRTSSGVRPTAIGQRLVDNGAGILRRAQETERELKLMMGLEIGELRVGAGLYPAEISVGQAASRFLQAYPLLTLEVSVGDWTHMTPRIASGEIDLFVGTTSTAVHDTRQSVEPLPRHQGYLFVRAGHPLMSRAAIELADVLAYPLAGTTFPPEIGAHFDVGDRPFGSVRSDGVFVPRVRVDTFRLARQIVLQTEAVGIATAGQITEDLRLGRLHMLPLKLPWLRSSFAIVRLAERTPSPAEEAFCRILRQVEAEVIRIEAELPLGAGATR
jgi:DNA-binding transcriptional LysR family regulator